LRICDSATFRNPAKQFKLTDYKQHQSLTLPKERDTLVKFGAATRVSQFQGLQGRQVQARRSARRDCDGFDRLASMQCSCMRPMQHNFMKEAVSATQRHA
jgi:hypothetical protein